MVSSSQLVADVALLREADAEWARQAIPFTGRWNRAPANTPILPMARELMEQNDIDGTIDFLSRAASFIEDDPELGKLLVWIADELMKRQRSAEAIPFYEQALARSPNDIVVMNNVAWQLATNPDDRIRNGEKAIHWSERAAKQSSFLDPNILSTLAASYAEAGRFDDAVKITRQAIERATRMNQADFVKRQQARLELFRNRRPYRDR
jgi:tetratricopeptide (TPR) repeat protein